MAKVWVNYADDGTTINGVFGTEQTSIPVTAIDDSDPAIVEFLKPKPLQVILPQELIAQFTPADMVKIMSAVNADTTGQTQLLWFAMVAQRDPMIVSNARFLAGWSLLINVLGQSRMDAIATALGVTVKTS